MTPREICFHKGVLPPPLLGMLAAAALSLGFLASSGPGLASTPLGVTASTGVAPTVQFSPVITSVMPSTVPNDINATLVISGAHFTAPVSVFVGGESLSEVVVITATRIEAVLPWGWDVGVYDLRVTTSDPLSPTVTLANAITVTQAIGVWTTNGPYGGDAIGVYVHPDDENLVFASMREVGLFRSADGGASWQKVFSESPFIFAVAPSDHTILYQSWVILHKSTDGGLTWQMIHNPASPLYTGEATAFLVHPSDPNRLYVGIPDRNTVNSGFFYSPDGGLTWEKKENGLVHNSVAGAVFHPDDPQRIFLATQDGYLYETTDGAETWIERGHPYDHFTSLAIDPFGDHSLWISQCPEDYYGIQEIARASLSDLASWESFPLMNATGWCTNAQIVFDPVNNGTIYVSVHTDLYKTLDGGLSWYPEITEFQISGLALSPAAPEVIYARHWGQGIQKSADGGFHWEKVNNGLAAVIPWTLAAAPGFPDEVYVGGNPYGLYWSDTGGHTWLDLGENSGSNSLEVDAFTPGRVYSAVWDGVNISPDHGQSWNYADIQLTIPAWCDSCVGGFGAHGVASHPAVAGRILAGIAYAYDPPPGGGEWPGTIAVSEDYGQTWQEAQLPAPSGTTGEFAFSPSDANVVYATGFGGLIRSLDGGFTWEDITPEFLADGYALAVHPADSQMVFLAYNEWIYRSTDGGETWTPIYPLGGVWTMLYTPTDPPVLYAGTDGLWSSRDEGLTFTRAAGAMGQARVRQLAFSQDAERSVLYVGAAGGVAAPAGYLSATEDPAAAAGVYRNSRPILREKVYLPLIGQ